MRSTNLDVATLIEAAGLAAAAGGAEVIPRESFGGGYRKSNHYGTTREGGYPGAKLAKKASKGTLTHNGIR